MAPQHDADAHDPEAYGRAIAADYDSLYDDTLDTEGAVACLAELAAGGPVLELGVGTGRLALPLAARGLAVHGVDSSPEMIALLRAKAGGPDLPVTVGDFADLDLSEDFALVVLAFNTIFALPTQEAQVACFAIAAQHLRPGGRFVIEAFVPDPTRFTQGQMVRTYAIGVDQVILEVGEIDPAVQRMTTTKVRLGPDGIRLYPANHRYAWPCELDLMARLAGLRLDRRFAGWDRAPFTGASTHHVTVYERPPLTPRDGGGTG